MSYKVGDRVRIDEDLAGTSSPYTGVVKLLSLHVEGGTLWKVEVETLIDSAGEPVLDDDDNTYSVFESEIAEVLND